MSAGHTRLDRPFRFDSKHPTGGFTTGSSVRRRREDGTVADDSGRGESPSESRDEPPRPTGTVEP